MSKVDKKIISIFLLLIMLIAQISPVFATNDVAIEKTKETETIFMHLLDCGVDADNDGELSDEEWATVKNLELVVDEVEITKDSLDKAINLKSLILEGIDPNEIDFTNLTKLEKLYIDFYGYNSDEPIDIVLPELNNLKEIHISNSYVSSEYFEDEEGIVSSTIGKIDISKISNLEVIEMSNTYPCEIILPNLSNIKEFDISNSNAIELDLESATNLVRGEITICEDLDSVDTILPNVKLANNLLVEKTWSKGFQISKIDSKIDLQRGAIFTKGICKNLAENSILEINEEGHIVAKNIGVENIVINDELNREHNVQINVYKKDIDTTLGKTAMDVEILDEETVLKANGELWKITSDTTAEKIGTNIKDYVSSTVYCQTGGGYVEVEKLVKKDNTLTLKIDINGTIINKNITNFTDVSKDGIWYISNGKLYEVIINYITEQVDIELISDGAEDIINDCVIMNNVTYYRFAPGRYKTIANFKIIDYIEDYNALYLTDANNDTWFYDKENGTLEKIDYNIDDSYNWDEERPEWWDNYENEYLHCGDIIVLNDIVAQEWNNKFDCRIMTRKDGSIWIYSEKSGLTKVVESTSSGEENLVATPVKEKIKTKDIGDIKIIAGFETGKIVSTWVYESNLYKNFLVQVYDLNNEKVYDSYEWEWEYDSETGEYIKADNLKDEMFATGMNVVLTSGNVKQEYTVVIYGDLTSDGIIDAFDALTLIKGATKKVDFKSEIVKEAGRIIAKPGQEPTAVDALAIIKAANNKYTINQSK